MVQNTTELYHYYYTVILTKLKNNYAVNNNYPLILKYFIIEFLFIILIVPELKTKKKQISTGSIAKQLKLDIK